ncbi:MAG: aminotransferase class IV, partial [Nitrospirales bacterium]
MPDIGFLNGRFLPLEETRVSVEDRGFLFGDGVYEVIRTYRGRPFREEAHLARLERSASAIQLRPPYSIQEWRGWIEEGIRRSGYPEAKIYIQVTRGAAPRDHAFPEGVSPTAVMTVRTMPPPAPSLHTDGVSVVTLEDPRWARCDIKSVNLLANVLARQRAREAGAFEVLFLRGGEVTEGAVSNVMVVQGGTLLTPPEGPRILSGVTRAVVLELARKEGLPVQERAVTVEELRGGDEVL